MKKLIIVAVQCLFISWFMLSSGMAQTDSTEQPVQEKYETATQTDLKTDSNLKQSKWDLDRLIDDALLELPLFLKDIPRHIKSVSVFRIDGDEHIYVNTIALRYKIRDALVNDGRLKVVECRQCDNMKVYVEDESLVLSRTVETNAQVADLGKELKVDAYLQGVVTVDEEVGKVAFELQMVDINDASVVKSGRLESFYLRTTTDEAEKPKEEVVGETKVVKETPKCTMNLENLDLEEMFPKLMQRLPDVLGEMPDNINKVVLADLDIDGDYCIDTRRLQLLFEHTLVNNTGIQIVDCPICRSQYKFALKDSTLFHESAATGERMKRLSYQLGFDAYIKSDLKIHPDDGKLEFNFKVVGVENNTIVKAVSLKTIDEEIIDKDSEFSFTFIPFLYASISGVSEYDAAKGIHKVGKIEEMVGLQYRYIFKTIITNLMFGYDLEAFVNSPIASSEKMFATMASANLIFQYRLPYQFMGTRLIDVAFGYGATYVTSLVGKETAYFTGQSMKMEGDVHITPSLSAGLGYYMLGSEQLVFDTKDASGNNLTQDFSGNSLALYLRFSY